MAASGLTGMGAWRHSGQRRTRANHKIRSHARSEKRFCLFRWRDDELVPEGEDLDLEGGTCSWRGGPAISDISTAHMLDDANSAESQGQHFQPVWGFQQAQADCGRVQALAVDEVTERQVAGDEETMPPPVKGVHEVEKNPGIEVGGFQRIGLSYVV